MAGAAPHGEEGAAGGARHTGYGALGAVVRQGGLGGRLLQYAARVLLRYLLFKVLHAAEFAAPALGGEGGVAR